MSTATQKDVLSVFPELEDHAVVEILDMHATVDELEAALTILSSEDKGLVAMKRREGGEINRLLDILSQAGVGSMPERDR
ncbi:MAG: hypothetical protein QNJ19_05370 [Woeseiaceae bacterium]|nr:hypothetical protein [Woeseiaceae bacterium]